eukprot:Hpha_TRINITY_DN16459_c1_g3::TRINITY_DN16459_c1_g3_i1::g.162844::m.162844
MGNAARSAKAKTPAKPAMKKKTAAKKSDNPERRGRVVEASPPSFAGLEAAAREGDAKGVFFPRGRHAQEAAMKSWLGGVDEKGLDMGELGMRQLQIAPMRCSDVNCEAKHDEEAEPLAGSSDIHQACVDLAATLPPRFRKAVAQDAEQLAQVCVRLCPKVPWLIMRLEMSQFESCIRWHQDEYNSRAIITYTGPGTWAADDDAVLWERLKKTAGEDTNTDCVPSKRVKVMDTNSVLLMKGCVWPGIQGRGLTHKSPEIRGDPPPKRLILKVDLNDYPVPDLDVEEEEEEEGEEVEEEEEEEALAAAKRSQSATEEDKPKKVRRRS